MNKVLFSLYIYGIFKFIHHFPLASGYCFLSLLRYNKLKPNKKKAF